MNERLSSLNLNSNPWLASVTSLIVVSMQFIFYNKREFEFLIIELDYVKSKMMFERRGNDVSYHWFRTQSAPCKACGINKEKLGMERISNIFRLRIRCLRRRRWGERSGAAHYYLIRNEEIRAKFSVDMSIDELSAQYGLGKEMTSCVNVPHDVKLELTSGFRISDANEVGDFEKGFAHEEHSGITRAIIQIMMSLSDVIYH